MRSIDYEEIARGLRVTLAKLDEMIEARPGRQQELNRRKNEIRHRLKEVEALMRGEQAA